MWQKFTQLNAAEYVIEACSDAYIAEGFEGAILGICERYGQPPIVAYDKERCIEIIMKREGKTLDEALEEFTYKTQNSWIGDRTPAFVSMYDRKAFYPVVSSSTSIKDDPKEDIT